ncbi:MAG: hypothetical protein AB8H03_27450 [Saprospiraceae bacterium]
MGYGVAAYRVNLELLSSTFKNSEKEVRDKAIQAGISKHCSNVDIVKELIEDGKASNGDLGHEYFYAIEGIISKIGVFLPARNWSPVGIDEYGELESEFQNMDKLLPFKIPEPDDFPWVLALPRNLMTDELSTKIKAKLNDEGLFNELQKWIDEANQNDQDLVLYLY